MARKFKIGDFVLHTECEHPTAQLITHISDGKYHTGAYEWYDMAIEDKLRLATADEIQSASGLTTTTKPKKTLSKSDLRALMIDAWKVGYNLGRFEAGEVTSPGNDVDEILENFFKNK